VFEAGEGHCFPWLFSRATVLRVLDRPDIVTRGHVTSGDVRGCLQARNVNGRAADEWRLFL